MQPIGERIRKELENLAKKPGESNCFSDVPAADIEKAERTFRKTCAAVLQEWDCSEAQVELLAQVVANRGDAEKRGRLLTSDKIINFIRDQATRTLFEIARDIEQLLPLSSRPLSRECEVIELLDRFVKGIAPTQPGTLRNRMATRYRERLTAFLAHTQLSEEGFRAHVAGILRNGGLTEQAAIDRIWNRVGRDRLATLPDTDIAKMPANYRDWDHVVRMYERTATARRTRHEVDERAHAVLALINQLSRRVEAILNKSGHRVDGNDLIQDELALRLDRYLYLTPLSNWLVEQAVREGQQPRPHASIDDVPVNARPEPVTEEQITEEIANSAWWHKLIRLTFSARSRPGLDVLWTSFDDAAHDNRWPLKQLAAKMTRAAERDISEMAAELLKRRYQQRQRVILLVMDETRDEPPSDDEILHHIRTEFSPRSKAELPPAEVYHYRWLAALARVARHQGRPDWAVFAAYVMDGCLQPAAAARLAWPRGAWLPPDSDTLRPRADSELTDALCVMDLTSALTGLEFWVTPAALLRWVFLIQPGVAANILALGAPPDDWTRLRNALSPFPPTDSEDRP